MSKKKQWFKLKIALMVVGAAVLLVGGAVFAFPMMMEKSTKNLYLMAETKTYQAAGKSSSLWSVLLAQDDWRSEVYKQKYEMQASLKGQLDNSEQFGPEFDAIHDVIKQSEWRYNLQHDPKSLQNNAIIGIYYKENPLLQIHTLQNDQEIALKIPELHDRMFSLNLEKWLELIEELDNPYGIDWEQILETTNEATSSTEGAKDMQAVLAMSEELQAKLILKYGALLKDYLTDEHVVLSEDADKLRKLTVTLSEAEVHRMTGELIDTLRFDEEAMGYLSEIGLVYYRQSMGGGLYVGGLKEGSAEADKEVIAAQIKNMLYEIKLELQSFQLPDGIVMEVLLDKKDRIVSRTLLTTLKYEENTAIKTQLTTTDNWDVKDPRSTWNLKLTDPTDSSSSIEFAIETKGLMEKERGTWEAQGNLLVRTEDEDTFALDGTLKAERQKVDSGVKTDYTFALTADIDELQGGAELSGTVTYVLGHDTKAKQVDEQADISLQFELLNPMFDENIDVGVSFEVNNKTTYGEQVEMRQMDKDRLNLTELDTDELEEIAEEIQQNLEDWVINFMNDYPEIVTIFE